MSDRGGGGRRDFQKLAVVDATRSKFLARFPDDCAGACTFALPPAVQHGAARKHDCRGVYRRRGHQAGRRGLVAAGHKHDAVEWITEQHFDETEISKVAVERRGRPLSGLLNRMARELKCNAAGRANTLTHPLGKLNMMPIAGREVRSRLCDPYNR